MALFVDSVVCLLFQWFVFPPSLEKRQGRSYCCYLIRREQGRGKIDTGSDSPQVCMVKRRAKATGRNTGNSYWPYKQKLLHHEGSQTPVEGPRELMDLPSLEVLKIQLDEVLKNLP